MINLKRRWHVAAAATIATVGIVSGALFATSAHAQAFGVPGYPDLLCFSNNPAKDGTAVRLIDSRVTGVASKNAGRLIAYRWYLMKRDSRGNWWNDASDVRSGNLVTKYVPATSVDSRAAVCNRFTDGVYIVPRDSV